MSVFRQWCRSAHRVFSASHPRLRLGQVQEVMSAALGHKSYASFKSHDLPLLDQAAYAFVSVEAMVQRAAVLGTSLDAKLCREVARDLRITQHGDVLARDVLIDEQATFGFMRQLDNPDHPSGHALAREIGATFDGLTALMGEPLVRLDQAGEEWRWRVRSTAHASKGDEFFDLQVQAEVLFPRIGRRLFAACSVVNLERDGEWEVIDPNNVVTDYSYLSESDL